MYRKKKSVYMPPEKAVFIWKKLPYPIQIEEL